MGFDPNRPYKATPLDYFLVAASILVAAGFVVWGFFG